MRVSEKMRKALSILLCICMLVQNCPVMAFAAETDNLCEHHPEHTAECHYAEAAPGSDCTHVHDEDCGYIEAVEGVSCACEAAEDGTVTHVEGCGYVEAVAGAPCAHVHDEVCGYAEPVEAHECHYECAECANSESSVGDGSPVPETTAGDGGTGNPSPTDAPVCDCGTDDPAIHAVTCAVYVAPDNPVCTCAEACGVETQNFWCDVCGFDYTACGGSDTAAVYADEWFTVSGNTVTIDGTLGGKTEATEDDINALVEQLKAYVDNGITTIIVTGEEPAVIEVNGVIMPAVSEAIYRLTGSGNYGENNPYNGKIDLILSDVKEILEWEFYQAYALNSITLPKVTTIGDQAFQVCYYLKQITFGSVVTSIVQKNGLTFAVGEKVDGCDLVLNCGQLQTESTYKPDLENNVWFKPNWGGDVTWKSITLTHTEETAATCTAKATCSVCGDPYGEVDADAHSYGDWVSNGDNTHTRTCANDNTHTEKNDCSGGTATCKEQAVCDICKTAYGELGAHTAEPTYAPNAGDSTQHDVTYSCCGATVTEAHTLDVTTGKCVCGADMTVVATVTDGTNTYYAVDADTLNQAVTAILETGSRTFTVELPADAPAEMITAIRRAICDTEGVADGSINLTLKGVTSIPGTTNWDGVAFGPGDIFDEAGEFVDQELVTQLASINLPDVTEIGAQAFYFCENLVTVSVPKAQTIGAQALGYTALTSVEFPELTTIPTDMFSGTWTLSSAKFPKVTTIEEGGLLIGAKFKPENNPTPFPLELTAEGDITFNGSYHFNVVSQNYSGKVDLVLCCDKKDAVTFHDDGTATWQVRDDLSYTFKSITFKHSYVDGKCTVCGEDCTHTGGTATCTTLAVCEACGANYGEVDLTNHVSDVYTYTDNGNGTHSKVHECGVTVGEPDNHTIENHVCTSCGAMEITVSFNAGDYKWETGDQINFVREVEGIGIDDCVFTATVAEDGTVTWTADKPFCWYGEGEQKLFAAPNNGWSVDYFVIPEDQSTAAKLDEADLINGMWVGTPTTDTITFNMTHRMAKVTVNYEFAEGVSANISELKVYSIAQICLFSLDDWSIKLTSAGQHDVWVTPYLDGNQFTAFIIPETYATGEDFIKITLSDGTVREVKMNKDVTFADGAEYTYTVVITADGAYLTCADECSFEYTANEDGTHDKICTECGYVAVDNEGHTTERDENKANCQRSALCDLCGASYGEVDKTNHDENAEYANGFCVNCDAYEPATDSDSNGYYDIDNAGKLYWFAAQVNSGKTNINGELKANIVINKDVLAEMIRFNPDPSRFRLWTPIGTEDNAYIGDFCGLEYTVSGLYFNDSSASYVGLFGCVGSGMVNHVGVIDSYFNGYRAVGGVVGHNEGTVEYAYSNSYVGGTVCIGGVVGENRGTVKYAYNLGSISGLSEVGGVVGANVNTVKNCYNVVSISGDSLFGDVVGDNFGTLENCYYPADAETDELDGTTAKTWAQFKSGEVAYLLGRPFGQTIGTHSRPVLYGETVYYGYTSCGDTVAKYTNDETISAEKPDHTQKPTYTVNGNGTHSASYSCCGTTVTEDHSMDATTGKCVCGLEMAEAKVTSGGTDTYFETLKEALTAAKSGDTVTLCDNVDIGTTAHTIPAGVTFEGGSFTVSGQILLCNVGTINSGNFTLKVYNQESGVIAGGSFADVNNTNAAYIRGGSFAEIYANGGSISGGIRFQQLTYPCDGSTIDLSEAQLTGTEKIVVEEGFVLTASEIKLDTDRFALALEDGTIVSKLDSRIGYIVTHTSHSYETAYDDTHHWTVCACGKTTEKAEHSFTYSNNGENHTADCSGCDKTVTEEHTYSKETGFCVCGAECAHSFSEGVCLYCGYACQHPTDENTYYFMDSGTQHHYQCKDCYELVYGNHDYSYNPEYHVCICGAGEPVAYKFVFNYTDEDGKTESSGTVSYGNTLSYWEPGFNREGYYVIWCSDEALTKEYDLETPVTAPVTLYAKWVQYYDLYIEGILVDELNKDDILDDGTVSYDPTTNTLTLNNADIQGNDSDLWGGSYVGISYSDVENPLTLHLVGDNKVSALSDPSIHPTAIEISGSLTVTGDGNLTVTAAAAEGTYQEGAYGIRIDNGNATFQGTGTITANVTSVTKIAYMGGIWVGGNITVESGTVNAYANHNGTAETSGTADNVGAIYAEGNGNTVTINGGTVNAYSGTGYSETAAIGGGLGTNIVINGGTVTAVGGTGKTHKNSSVGCNSYGIGVGSVSRWNGETFVSEGGTVTINGGTVKATGGAASENSFGIGAEGGVTITGGEVTATGGTASVDSYGIGAGVETTGKVVISGGTVKATGGNATAASYGIGAKEGVEIAGTADVQASSGTGAVSYGIGTLGNVELENSIALEAQGGIMAIGAVKTATLEAGEYWLTVTNRDGITTHPARIESGDWTNLLYFKMEPGIPVYFDANGGAWGEEAIKAVQVEKSGDSVAKPGEDPVHSNGMVLKGWYDENGKLFDFSTPITQSITLTAKWGYQVTVYNEYGQADNITLSNTVAVPGEHFVTQVSATVGTGIKVTGIALDSDNPYWVGNRYFTFNKETKTLTIDAKFVTGDLLVEVVPYVTVKTHLNGGAVSEKWQYTYEADDDGVITVEWGIGDEGYLFPTWDNTANTLIDGTNEVFVREGHTVSAYNTASDGSGSNYETDEEFTFTQDTELYLIWKANEHTLTWIIDGVTTTEAVAYGAALTAPAAPADREGYTFTGWDGTIPDTMPNEDITVTLTSQWKANEYRVTLVADAVSGVSIDKTTATFGEDFTAIITVGNSAYELLSQHIYVTYADAEAADEENMLPFTYDAETGAFTIAAEYVTKDLRIEAVATEKTYTVILDFNGGMDANNHTTESTQIALGKETAISSLYCGALGLDGHELTGWNTEADGSGTQYGLTATVKSDVHNAVITLYAQWEAKEYKVTFNAPNVTITPMYGGDPDKANGDVAYMVNLTPAVGYGLPASIAVTVGGEPLSPMENHDPDTGYSYYMQEDGTANLIISANHITGDITVDVEAKLRTFTVTWTIDGETYATDSITYGEAITAPEPTKAQSGCTTYTFSGWAEEIPAAMPAEDLIFTGSFTESEIHDWSVTYSWNGDNTICTATRVCSRDAKHNVANRATATSEQMSAPTCTEKGWTTYTASFNADWAEEQTKNVQDIPELGHGHTEGYGYTDLDNGSHKQYCKDCGETTVESEIHTYDAEKHECICGDVEPITVTIVTPKTDSSDASTEQVTYDYGTTVALSLPADWTGHTFLGYAEGSAEGEIVASADRNCAFTFTKAVTLYAVYEANTHTVTWKLGGETVATTEVTYGQSITDPEIRIPDQYTSYAWTTELPATMPDEDLTVEGFWNVYLYYEGSAREAVFAVGTEVTLIDFTWETREGYTFSGWAKEENGEAAFKPGEKVTMTGNMILYPAWVLNTYAISWDTDGDGKIDKTDTVEHGTVPTAPDASKAKDGCTAYTFAAWDKEIVAAAEDATYTATFTQSVEHENVVTDKAVEPGCETTGLTEGSHCEACGETIVAQEEIPVTGHSDKTGDGDHNCDECGDKLSDCTDAEGDKDHKCDECGKDGITDCSDKDSDGDHNCDECGDKLSDCTDAEGDKDHKCDECGKDGITVCSDSATDQDHNCDECGKQVNDHIAGDVVTENAVSATCTTAGSYENVVYCTVCDAELSRQKVTVPATGHTDDDDDFICDDCDQDLCTEHTEAVIPGQAATCTEGGLTDGVMCSVCGEILVQQEEIPALGHTDGEAVTENEVAATCTADGSYDNVVYCTVCDAELSRETIPVPATGHTDDDEDNICDDCGEELPGKKDGIPVIFPEEDDTGTILPGAPAEIDGTPVEIDEDGELWLPNSEGRLLVTYKYNTESDDPYDVYPTDLYVWELTYTDEDGNGTMDVCTADRVEELDNFLVYEGTSIRVNYSSDGIRFFTSVPTAARNKLMKGNLLTGNLEGYTLVEMGTLYKWASSESELLRGAAASYVYGGSAGEKFREYAQKGTRSWFTGMLTEIPGDAETLNSDIVSRPYMVLERDGEQITLYGGVVQRSIYYVAKQNADHWATGTDFDNYVENIIATVEAVYGKSEQP